MEQQEIQLVRGNLRQLLNVNSRIVAAQQCTLEVEPVNTQNSPVHRRHADRHTHHNSKHPITGRPGSDLRFLKSTHLKLFDFQFTFQLSWNLFFQLSSKIFALLFDLGLNGMIVLSHCKRKQVHAIAIMAPSIRLTA